MHSKRKSPFQSVLRTVRITVSIIVIGIANTAAADNFLTRWLPSFTASQPAKPAPQVARGELIYVVCSSDGARVRSADLKSVAFNAKPNEIIKMFQGWGENKKNVNINGENTTFVRAQFDSSNGTGWIAEKYVKLKSQCSLPSTPAAQTNIAAVNISGLNDSKCCRFPISHEPFLSYTTGERQFGALRAKGRVHAGSDLYGNQNEPILSVAAGTVTRGLYSFYFGTYAVDVRHQGGFVVRYGEVSGKRAAKAVTGETLRMGETVAHMGQLVPRIRPPMLHFEMYRGSMNGILSVKTTRRNQYGRRKDLIDPTDHLQNWESKAF